MFPTSSMSRINLLSSGWCPTLPKCRRCSEWFLRGFHSPLFLKLRPGRKVARGQATAVLCCNDWHVEGCVTPQSVDGANEFQIYRYIILPLLQPVTLSAVIILGHMSLKIFDLIVAIGHKDMRLDVPGIYMWTTTFDGTRYAQGAAIGVLMLVSVAILVVPYLIYSMRTEAEL